jgi:acetyl-CoA carboxylase, biotin carboxylase subunit
VFLGERECSIQRRHQKVIEETPSTKVDDAMRTAMGLDAVRLVQSVGYSNAGTVEFLVDEHQQFYFLEVNTRLQVEHPVTELVTGIDLVRQQILVADGQRLSLGQGDIHKKGYALECRICAEDPENNFFPSTGNLTHYILPQGPRVRVDNGLSQGDSVSIYYDSLMAKVITWGPNRSEAIEGMKRALAEFRIHGVKTTIPFCLFVLNNDSFRLGKFDTGFVEREFNPETLRAVSEEREIAAAVAAVLMVRGAWTAHDSMATKNHHGGVQSSWKNLRTESHH